MTPSPTEASQSPFNYIESVDTKLPRKTFLNFNESSQKFELAPTPAQLGLRRSGRKPKTLTLNTVTSTSDDDNHHQITDANQSSQSATSESYHEYDATNTELILNSANKITTPSSIPDEFDFKERFRSLPQFDYDNYKSPTQWPSFTSYYSQSKSCAHEPYRKKCGSIQSGSVLTQEKQQLLHFQSKSRTSDTPAPATKSLVGNHFFGPDFNVEYFKSEYFIYTETINAFWKFEIN